MVEESKKYKHNFLTNVLFKLDFPSITDFGAKKLKQFQNKIKKVFPILKEEKGPLFEISLGENQKVNTKTSDLLKWTFFDKDNKKIVSIEHNNVILEITNYTSFGDFLENLRLLIEGLREIAPEISSTRIGLRYINQIKINEDNPFDLQGYFKEELIKSKEIIENEKKIIRAMSSIETREDNYQMRFQYGIHNSLYPEKIIKKEFILDYDCYTNDSIDLPEIEEQIKLFHKKISELFEQSIKDKLRELMNQDD